MRPQADAPTGEISNDTDLSDASAPLFEDLSGGLPTLATPTRACVRRRYYLGESFVVEHAPATPRVNANAILLLGPLGYEDICAWRPLRILADHLADAGHVVLHMDWPGAGDGAVDDVDEDVVASGVRAVTTAVGALRARGFERVGAVAVRAGGLIALAAPLLDALVLWAPPASGRAYLREERAFHRMAAHAFGSAPAGAPPNPEGSIEAGGFLYAPGSVASLEGQSIVDLVRAAPRRRVLWIGRSGAEPDDAIVQAFKAAGTPLETSAVDGLPDLVDDPYRATLSVGAGRAIVGWFARERQRVALRPAGGADTLVTSSGVRERPWVSAGTAGELSGIVSEPPVGRPASRDWTIFLNAGGVRRCGPNRLWTRAARALAQDGRPSLRLDVRDVGDSDGVSVPHGNLDEMYSEASIRDVVLAWDWVHEQGADSIDVVGLCSGAFLGMQLAARREVRGALLFNGLAFQWNEDARASGWTAHIGRSLLDGRRWRRLLTGRIDAVALARAIVRKLVLKTGALIDRLAGRPARDEVAELVRAVQARGTRLHLLASEGDPAIAYLEAHVAADERPPLTVLPAVDHTLRPVWAHADVIDRIVHRRGSSPS